MRMVFLETLDLGGIRIPETMKAGQRKWQVRGVHLIGPIRWALTVRGPPPLLL
jgi:hypothetical protein